MQAKIAMGSLDFGPVTENSENSAPSRIDLCRERLPSVSDIVRQGTDSAIPFFTSAIENPLLLTYIPDIVKQ